MSHTGYFSAFWSNHGSNAATQGTSVPPQLMSSLTVRLVTFSASSIEERYRICPHFVIQEYSIDNFYDKNPEI